MDSLHLLAKGNYDTLSRAQQLAIFQEFYRFVFPQARRIVRDYAAAEDIVQEAFLKSVRKMPPHLRNMLQVQAWIRTVAKNQAITYLRKHPDISGAYDTCSSAAGAHVPLPMQSPSPEKEVECRLMTETVARCVHSLKPEYKSIVLLRWRYGLSYKEIATRLNMTEQNVKTRLFRAREAVRQKFMLEWGS
ncbi:RNA polymerase sigma factor [Paenibacillus tarimensis]|uniref:RNA polymerase sigma factor n=1 Tax=Paenibacillus tarimensis TaxID=416012 RepID=UPI001F269080|nr:sigma-70 family RNA polymerase sigma factor [Paenibacillus tarimensis]MCF2944254.1 sigma-70 family RNA polymerase sigma factor [Paenibacillus tarimensis]